MDINKLITIIEGKEECTKDTLNEIKKLINDFPYFQIGHMLFLKALHSCDKENYNEQLKISGVFISNKAKLFKFINRSASELKADEIPQNETIQEKKIEKTNEVISETKTEKTFKDIKIRKELPTKESLSENIETKKTTEKENKVVKDIKSEQKIIQKSDTSSIVKEKEQKSKITEIKKKKDISPNISDVDIYEKSKQQHKKIVKDFFIDPDKDVKIIDETTNPDEITKLINIPEKNVKEREKTTVKVSKIERIRKKVQAKKETVNTSKPDVKKEKEIKKTIPSVQNEEKEILGKNVDIKRTSIPPEVKKADKSTGVKKQADVMNEIFSKIRAIKKEMNITTDEQKEIVEIKPERIEKPHRIIEKDEKRIKGESIKQEKLLKKNELNEINETKSKLEEKDEKTEQIIIDTEQETENKDNQEITAWDLVKQHQENKDKKANKSFSGKSKIEEYIEKQINNKDTHDEIEAKSKITKIQEVLAEDTKENISDKIEKKEVETVSDKIETKDLESEEKESAADALLRKIALKKQQLKQSKEEANVNEDIEKNTKKEEIVNHEIDENKNNEKQNIKIEENREESIVSKAIPEKKKLKKTQKLIEEFINKADSLERIKPDREPSIKGDISVKSTVEKDDFITEAMADLYVQQKYYQKAIDAYKKLILKFPQKKTYFAIQIKKVESLIKK